PHSEFLEPEMQFVIFLLSVQVLVVAPVLGHIIGTIGNSTLINGLGRYEGGPASELAVVSLEYGKRYRLRLIAMSCHNNFAFSIDNHNLTVIEADGELTEPLLVDSMTILAGQRYSVVLTMNQPVGNYWIRALPNPPGSTFGDGQSLAILRYKGAPVADPPDPTTKQTKSTMPLLETNLHAFINPGAPGVP
ncbi:Cupredoxin, partial [Suillus clintonianus]|uniref:Cupredoxin n=1 Tax=Suillus clintonianus TaxID=1904413 RepID=UPI001B878170